MDDLISMAESLVRRLGIKTYAELPEYLEAIQTISALVARVRALERQLKDANAKWIYELNKAEELMQNGFNPDWANYQQGLEDGKAEGGEQAARECAEIVEDMGAKVFHPTQVITDRCAAAIRQRFGI